MTKPSLRKMKMVSAVATTEIINAKTKGKIAKFNFSIYVMIDTTRKKAAKYITVSRSAAPSITTATTISCR